MRIVCVCGMGFGTSLMMKMTIGDVLKAHAITADLQHWDLGSAKGQTADIIVAPRDMERHLKDFKARLVFIDNIVSRKEIEAKIMPVVQELQGK